MNDRDDELGPNPAALVESLRAFPYSTSSAVADLIDNSIAANARNVRIYVHWNGGAPLVDIVDDGWGMSSERLREALRFAGLGPSSPRELSDLGRFGLGLKTASLSQCSRMTVTTVHNGKPSHLGWDIEELRASGSRWQTASSSSETVGRQIEMLNGKDGTVVRWQKLDRLLGTSDTEIESNDIDSIFERVADHLEMVFHRFMSRSLPDGKPQLRISVNDRQLKPWDPFLDRYPVEGQVWKIEDENIQLPSGVSSVAGFVLPAEREAIADDCLELWEAAGRRRWNQLQGFYVYRLDRLITYGGYLGLGRLQDEHTKLARIAIELDNNTDNDWLLDVTKSAVTPPPRTRRQLDRVARSVCSKASNRYRSRVRKFCTTCNSRPCKCPRPPQFELVWKYPNLVDEIGKIAVNEQHSMITQFREILPADQSKQLTRIIRLISKTVPATYLRGVPAGEETLYLDRFDSSSASELLVRELIETAIATRYQRGETLEEIQRSLQLIEPFSDFPYIIEDALEKFRQVEQQ